MRRYWIAVAILCLFIVATFSIAQRSGYQLFTDPTVWLKYRGIFPAMVAILLLVSDVWLPIPSSVIMTANGALFGVFMGTIISLVGAFGATLAGFGVGRAGGELLKRLVTTREYEASEVLLSQWGILALVITRPVPILSETVAILAGASSLTWKQVSLASVVGALPAAFLYAFAGATTSSLKTGILVFVLVLLFGGSFWFIYRRFTLAR